MWLISSTGFDCFECKHDNVARINLHQLYEKLIKMGGTNEDLVTIHADEGQIKRVGFFVFSAESTQSNNLACFLKFSILNGLRRLMV